MINEHCVVDDNSKAPVAIFWNCIAAIRFVQILCSVILYVLGATFTAVSALVPRLRSVLAKEFIGEASGQQSQPGAPEAQISNAGRFELVNHQTSSTGQLA